MSDFFICKIVAMSLIGVCFLATLPAFALKSELFTVTTHPFTGVPQTMSVCYLDQINVPLRALNQKLATMPPRSAAQLAQHYQPQFQKIAWTITCAYRAKALRIHQLPAIVFNGRRVVYGITSYPHAMRCYQQVTRGQRCH
jgi:integrating conjugative element protein (TIGR03757 family)